MKLYEKSAGRFLDITSCGSSIRWGVALSGSKSKKTGKYSTRFHFDIGLTDCNRCIEWTAYQASTARRKLTQSIKEFEAALAAVNAAQKVARRVKASK